MAFLALSELKSFDIETLAKEIVNTKKQLFELRLKKATRQSFKPHLFKHNKRKIAQLLTLESEKQQQIK
jgi:large subunit ribosomal protein L29